MKRKTRRQKAQMILGSALLHCKGSANDQRERLSYQAKCPWPADQRVHQLLQKSTQIKRDLRRNTVKVTL